MMRPNKEDHIPYFENYISLVQEQELISALMNNKNEMLQLISAISASKQNYAYADGKWTIKQVLNQITDSERIFCCRALRFARGDSQLLGSYDEDLYAANAQLNNTTIDILLEEFKAVRESSILFFKQLTEKELKLNGQMESGQTTVLSLGYLICGHSKHHMNVLQLRYLN
jgi:uncharacterized damage-inducible protein DinB